jgi:hypothetical protein
VPNKVNFSGITNVKLIGVKAEGWINPLSVEYGLGMHLNLHSYFWRVKGTEHTFVIPISRLEFLSSGEYAKHFEEALEGFRADYLEWKDSGFAADWMREYRKEYGRFILV